MRFVWIILFAVMLVGCIPSEELAETLLEEPTQTPQETSDSSPVFDVITNGNHDLQIVGTTSKFPSSLLEYVTINEGFTQLGVNFITSDENFDLKKCGEIESGAGSFVAISFSETIGPSGTVDDLVSCFFIVHEDATDLSFHPTDYPSVSLGF